MLKPAGKRLTLDMTEAEHRALKTRASAVGLSMKDLILELLRREGWIEELRARRTEHR